jgi:cholesterol transport system auxiliary component
MKFAINSIATYAYWTASRAFFVAGVLAFTGCAWQNREARPAVFDFGPGSLSAASASPAQASPLIIGELEASPALDGTAVLYRLAYDDAQQLRAYAQARWSMPPVELLRQRLRQRLGENRALQNPGESSASRASPLAATAPPATLRIELEEFSQLFESPTHSVGLLRLRATLLRTSAAGEKSLFQRQIVVQRPCASADAPGGVRALTAATDAALQELQQWLQTLDKF